MGLKVEEYVIKGNEFINQVATHLERPENTDFAGLITVSVFSTLRDVLTPEESIHLIAQLPLYIKAAYVDGWKISNRAEKHNTLNIFLEKLREQGSNETVQDFNTIDAKKSFQAVLSVLEKYVSQGEIKQVIGQLSLDLIQTEN